MSLTDKLLAVPRLIENEFESGVNALYRLYHRHTGKDQYSLSNLYIFGGFGYDVCHMALSGQVNFSQLIPDGLKEILLPSGLNTMMVGALNRYLHKKQMGSVVSDEAILDPKIEDTRFVMKQCGRLLLVYVVNSVITDVTGFSPLGFIIYQVTESHPAPLFNQASALLYALGYYTTAMDIHKPKKSRVMEVVKNLAPIRIPQPVKIPVDN